MIPHFAPPKRCSAITHNNALFTGSKVTPPIASKNVAVATSIAADELSPPPAGTLLSSISSKPLGV